MTTKILTVGALTSAWLAFAALAGCGTKETTEIPGPPYPTASSYCQALAEAVCSQAVVQACFGSTADSLAADTANCVNNYSQGPNCNPGGYAYDNRNGKSCIEIIAAMYSDGRLASDELAAVQTIILTDDGRLACLAAFNAGRGTGAPCMGDEECNVSDNLRCVVTSSGAGSCQIPVVTGPAEPCAEAAQQCDEAQDLYCGSDLQCIRKPDVGGTCSLTDPIVPCREDAQCVVDTCQAKIANGVTCTLDEQCEGGFCVKALAATSGTCSGVLVLNQTTERACEPFLPGM